MLYFSLFLSLISISLAVAGNTGTFSDDQCDLSADGAICLFGGRKVLLPDARPKGLLAHWKFDEVTVIDSSGNKNHGANAIVPGPGLWGRGASAYFDGYDYAEILPTKILGEAAAEFSLTAWIYLVDAPSHKGDPNGKLCPLIFRGSKENCPSGDDKCTGAPALLLQTKSRKLKFVSQHTNDSVSLESSARMPLQRWMHIALVRSKNDVSLYVNGILDSRKNTDGQVGAFSKDSLYIGAVPWLKDECMTQSYIDGVRLYKVAITMNEIQAEASPALGGIPPSFLHLGCLKCTAADAETKCKENYHICTETELHSGGYQVARIMGYATWESEFWTAKGVKNGDSQEKLSVCCSDIL